MFFDAHTHLGLHVAVDDKGLADWLATWTQFGVTHGAVFPMDGLMSDSRVRQNNDEVAAACARSGGRMLPFCTVNPNFGADALAEFRRCLETLGCRGLKLHPWLQGIGPNSKEVDALCELAGEFHVPVLFHDGTPCFSLPSQMALLARRHPQTTIILGHCGLFEHWREAIDAMHYADNVWGCLCSPHLAAHRELVARADKRRLLWGSDHGFGSIDQVVYRTGLFRLLDLGDDDRDAIVHRNPARLFGLAA
ncbi:MAG: amidohydrolase family protein [Thermoguttaceae bacterium]